jgi:hypothetical protein
VNGDSSSSRIRDGDTANKGKLSGSTVSMVVLADTDGDMTFVEGSIGIVSSRFSNWDMLQSVVAVLITSIVASCAIIVVVGDLVVGL